MVIYVEKNGWKGVKLLLIYDELIYTEDETIFLADLRCNNDARNGYKYCFSFVWLVIGIEKLLGRMQENKYFLTEPFLEINYFAVLRNWNYSMIIGLLLRFLEYFTRQKSEL